MCFLIIRSAKFKSVLKFMSSQSFIELRLAELPLYKLILAGNIQHGKIMKKLTNL